MNEQVVSEAVALGRRAVKECGDDPDLRVECLLSLAEPMRGDDWGAARATTQEALALARTASRPALRAALAAAGELEVLMTPGGGRELLREALALEAELTSPFGWWDPAITLGAAHIWADELDEARELLESARERAMDAGDEESVEDSDRYLAQLEVRAGRLARARAYAEEGIAMASQTVDLEGLDEMVEEAYVADTLPTIQSLVSEFGSEPDTIRLSYASSYSVVSYLEETHGAEIIDQLIAAYAEGLSHDAVLMSVLDTDTAGLNVQWREYLESQIDG